MTGISMGIQSPLVISCPCIALPRGTVVVNREDLRDALQWITDHHTLAGFYPREGLKRLREALEGK